jgi:Arc/MetJ-type ribon-helix-helix transcriptional regulator
MIGPVPFHLSARLPICYVHGETREHAMNIRLKPDTEQWLRSQVEQGRFGSVEEAVDLIAERFVLRLIAKAKTLRWMPLRHRVRDELPSELRAVPIAKYLIFTGSQTT